MFFGVFAAHSIAFSAPSELPTALLATLDALVTATALDANRRLRGESAREGLPRRPHASRPTRRPSHVAGLGAWLAAGAYPADAR